MLDSLLREKDRLLFHYFEFPDRVAHVFWRFRDPKHPAYDAALAKKYGDAVEKSYETVDAIVGDAAKALAPEDVLIVLSDHGFATWRRSVNYNSWLVENGYLVLTGGAQRKSLEALFSRGAFWENVDWTKSRAYAMGLGDLYVNLRGRERGGIVSPGAEYEALRAELIPRLTALTDPKNGERAVSRVFKREDVYRRFDPRVIPDLIVTNTRGYRVSWQSSLGVPTANVFEDNRDVWSGDHCSVDPDLVRGILFSSRRFRAESIPGIADVTASVRALIGAPAPAEAAGKSRSGNGALPRPRIRRVDRAIGCLAVAAASPRSGRGGRNRPVAGAAGTADLAAIRARIAALKSRLSESEKNVASLSEEVRRLDWKLEIAREESKLLAARRAELTKALAATRTERETAAASGADSPGARSFPARAFCRGSGVSDTSACSSRRRTRRGSCRVSDGSTILPGATAASSWRAAEPSAGSRKTSPEKRR